MVTTVRLLALVSAMLASGSALACSPPLHDPKRLAKAADAVVVGRTQVLRSEAYEIDGVLNRRGLAVVKPRRVVRGERAPSYRIRFDTEDDGVNCPRWQPPFDERVQRLYLVRTGEPGLYEVLDTDR